MEKVQVKLLGQARVLYEGKWQLLPRDKRGALLVYLAFCNDWLSRDELAFTFWPDSDASSAKANLRQVLRRSRQFEFAYGLESSGQQLRWSVETDLLEYKVKMDQQDWFAALDSYSDHLLVDFSIPEAEGFMAWLELERAELQETWQQAVYKGSSALAQTDRHSEAAELIKRIWKLDAFDEKNVRNYMREAYLAGNQTAALNVYESFTALLKEDMQLEPVKETQALAQAIKRGELSNEQLQPKRRFELRSATSFIGRDNELEQLKHALTISETQLFALTGLGGVGKTRLALECAKTVIPEFEHGVSFVPLAAAEASTFISAIAKALSFSFYGSRDPKEQLLDYLRNKNMLLIMDNFEHLTDKADVLLDLVTEAPNLKLLITSREKPELPSLWTHTLRGLDYQQNNSAAETLFLNAAKHKKPNLQIGSTDLEATRDLCELLEGLPLGLELAAAWVAELPIREMVQEIKTNVSFLKRDGKRHHDSLTAVLEHSWNLLSPEQQTTLAKLSVFRGGFSKEAVQEIAAASHYLVLSLLNRSLIRKQESRYDLHEVVRQYAESKLEQLNLSTDVRNSHGSFYLDFAMKHEHRLKNNLQSQTVAAFDVDRNNLVAAWTWACRQTGFDSLVEAAEALSYYFEIKCLFQEGALLFEQALKNVERQTLTYARLVARKTALESKSGQGQDCIKNLEEALNIATKFQDESEIAYVKFYLGYSNRMLGCWDEAEKWWQESLEHYQALNMIKELADATNNLGLVAFVKGFLDKSLALFAKALVLREQTGDKRSIGISLNNLCILHANHGNYELAISMAKDSLVISEGLEDKVGIAYSFNSLGTIYHNMGEFEQATEYYQKGVDVRRDLGDTWGTAVSLDNLGRSLNTLENHYDALSILQEALSLHLSINDKQGQAISLAYLANCQLQLANFAEAEANYIDSIKLHEEVSNTLGIATSYCGLSQVYLSQQKLEQAAQFLRQALEIIQDSTSIITQSHCLVEAAAFLVQRKHVEQAMRLAVAVANHKTSSALDKQKAKQIQAGLKNQDLPASVDTDFSELIKETLTFLI